MGRGRGRGRQSSAAAPLQPPPPRQGSSPPLPRRRPRRYPPEVTRMRTCELARTRAAGRPHPPHDSRAGLPRPYHPLYVQRRGGVCDTEQPRRRLSDDVFPYCPLRRSSGKGGDGNANRTNRVQIATRSGQACTFRTGSSKASTDRTRLKPLPNHCARSWIGPRLS